MKRKRTLRRRLAYVSILLMLLLGCAEVVLRVAFPMSTFVRGSDRLKVWFLDNVDTSKKREPHPQNVSDPFLGWTHGKNIERPDFSTNSQGMRGSREYRIERTKGVRRGMVLGDSFSMGHGVADADVYSVQLERLLPDTEVPNLAVAGYGVDQAILRWEQIGRQYSPDFVILGIFTPDFQRNVDTWRFDAPKPRFYVVDGKLELSTYELPPIEDLVGNERRLEAELAGLYWTPRVWVAGRYCVDRVAAKLRGHREPDATFGEKAEIQRLLIGRLAQDCKALGAKLIVVSIHTENDLYPDEDRIIDVIADGCKDQGVPFLRLAHDVGATPAQLAEQPVFLPDTGHWSPLGHRLAAQKIVAFLRQHRIVE